MIKLAKHMPEFPAALYGVGETLAAKLIGDPRRFESKRAAYVGPSKDDSGKKVSISGKISRIGDAFIRKAVFQVVECQFPAPVYQFLDKKRSEGKLYYMTAASNKFLRIYYARIKEYLDKLEGKNSTDAPASVSTETAPSECAANAPEIDSVECATNTPETEPIECITNTPEANNNIAFTCVQDSADRHERFARFANGAVKPKRRRLKSVPATS